MPIHDWSRVDAGIFHHFHHSWIEEIQRALNAGLLPQDYYAMSEQYTGGFEPDVLALLGGRNGNGHAEKNFDPGGGGVLLATPKVQLTAEAEMDSYPRKAKAVTVRHVSDDGVVAMIEVVSPGNKSSRAVIHAFVEKAVFLLERRIHLLILDLNPPTKRDPNGIHDVIWEELTGRSYSPPEGKPLSLASYECAPVIRAYVHATAVGEPLVEMPLFLEPGAHVPVPLEQIYQRAFEVVPRRWQRVLTADDGAE